jgi:hypothetical protein
MASIAAGKGNLASTAQGEPVGLPLGAIMARDAAFCVQMVATSALNPGDAVLQDFVTGLFQVVKTGAADSTSRFGIAVTGAAAGQDVWVAVMGFCQSIASAAIAAGAAIANSATAGQTKTAAAAGGRTNLGWAITAAAGAASVFQAWMDKS